MKVRYGDEKVLNTNSWSYKQNMSLKNIFEVIIKIDSNPICLSPSHFVKRSILFVNVMLSTQAVEMMTSYKLGIPKHQWNKWKLLLWQGNINTFH